jgi:hypothetical protein
MHRLNQGRMDRLVVKPPIDRPHAPKKINRLGWCISEEFRDDFDRTCRPNDCDDRQDVDGIAGEALRQTEPLPSHRVPADHWNSFLTYTDTSSLSMTMAIIAIRMVST